MNRRYAGVTVAPHLELETLVMYPLISTLICERAASVRSCPLAGHDALRVLRGNQCKQTVHDERPIHANPAARLAIQYTPQETGRPQQPPAAVVVRVVVVVE